jgi:hypothetical protein
MEALPAGIPLHIALSANAVFNAVYRLGLIRHGFAAQAASFMA